MVLNILEKDTEQVASVHVNKHLELDLDLGCLLAVDQNVLAKNSLDNDSLLNLNRDNVQFLFNKLWELPSERVEEAIVVKLPSPIFKLPRCKPVPKAKALTKWQQFAKEKGIQKKKKAKLTWDDQLKKWVPRFGFMKAMAENEKNWVLDVPSNAPFEDQFEKKLTAKADKIAKNELQRLRNVAKAKDIKIPRFGILNPKQSSAKDLQTAITVAKSSTGSVGKFQENLHHEKEACGIATITPGASSRKRKLPPVSGDEEKKRNLTIVDSILHKRPKLDIEQAVVSRHHSSQTETQKYNPEKRLRKSKGPGNGKSKISSKPSKSKKPASGKGQRRGKGGGGGGRKRR